MTDKATEVLSFWWSAESAAWFSADPAFDDRVRAALGDLHEEAAAGGCAGWAATPHGALAEILLLDQVPRNIFRGTPRAFATDGRALAAAHAALAANHPAAFPPVARAFFFLPFEHAEDMEAQSLAVDLFRGLGDRELYFYALLHMDAIRRFGRFPHRNAILGRASTAEEEAYLASGGFRA